MRLTCRAALVTTIFVVGALIGRADARNCDDRMAQPEPANIAELVKKSTWIALYDAHLAADLHRTAQRAQTDAMIDEAVELFDYQLGITGWLKGEPPYQLHLVGAAPFKNIPAIYFDMFNRHQDMVKDDELGLGVAGSLVDFGTKGCEYIPEFMPGYTYLIFGGVNSKARFEPIFSERHDAFFAEVQRLSMPAQQGKTLK